MNKEERIQHLMNAFCYTRGEAERMEVTLTKTSEDLLAYSKEHRLPLSANVFRNQ